MKKAMFSKVIVLLGLFFSSASLATVQIETWKTSKGTKVLFVEAKQLPMLDIDVTFDAGSARDGENGGLANLTSSLIGTATSNLDEEQISEAFNDIGANLGSGASLDNTSLSLRTLTRPEIKQKALDRFVEVLTDSRFDQAIFDREIKRLKIGLRQKSVKPQVINREKLMETLYGDHPYAQPSSGTLASVENLSVEKIQQFYKTYYVANNAVISMVGNVSLAEAKAIAEKLTEKMPAGKKANPIAEPKVSYKAETIKVDFDSTQTYYAFAKQSVKRGDPDWVPLYVGNHLFGGSGFASFLMEEVREKRGLVYSVYSYFSPFKQNGLFVVGLSTKNASALEADKVVKDTLDGFLKDFPEEKLQAIKDNLTGGFPLRIDSNSKILGYITLIGFYDLPLNYLDWFPQQVEKVTKEDVLKAWRKQVVPEEMVTIMVGKPE